MSVIGADLDAYLIYALAWLAYGALHSALCGDGVKARLKPLLGAGYRLAYNVFAVAALVPVLAVGHWAFAGSRPFGFGEDAMVALGIAELAGWGLMLLALRDYDLGRFAGITQIRAARLDIDVDEDEPLHTEGFHRYVRHPVYSAGFLILAGGIWTPPGLATAVFVGLYLIVGTIFEERRLLARYGEAYAAYKAKVPAFIPWRGRALKD